MVVSPASNPSKHTGHSSPTFAHTASLGKASITVVVRPATCTCPCLCDNVVVDERLVLRKSNRFKHCFNDRTHVASQSITLEFLLLSSRQRLLSKYIKCAVCEDCG
ncbi:hypothetical protein Mapa_014377 [Marchantia paleacea]|nr:hypothetical protein Mapa_014377 [Marchantia paleacea]